LNTNTKQVCMTNTGPPTIKHLAQAGAAFCLALMVMGAQAQVPYVSATVSGELQPGVYGRIDIGNAPPPPLIYSQPLIIQRPAVFVQQQPLYLHVPPGHAKKWSKHCGKYKACGQPVYFVKVQGDDDYERRSYQRRNEYRSDDHDGDSKHSGKGKDKHKNKGNKHDD
jgi:hypothetical protein